jgi:chromate transporter
VVTYFTFLPSFVFILAGGPWVESSRSTLRFKGPLTAISAAVVGVILNLALFFAGKVLFPGGFSVTPDYPAIIILVCSWVALTRFKLGIIPVIFLSGGSGYLMSVLPTLLRGGF